MNSLNPLDLVTLEAFLTALAQLDSVPSDVLNQLKNLGAISSDNVGRLNAVAETYSLLNALYDEARLVIGDDSERNKGPIPEIDHQAENHSLELINLADEIFSSSNPENTIKKAYSKPGLLKYLPDLVKRPKT